VKHKGPRRGRGVRSVKADDDEAKGQPKVITRQTRDETGISCIDQEVKSRDTSYLDRDLKYYGIQGEGS
jgi:hypothetical protein